MTTGEKYGIIQGMDSIVAWVPMNPYIPNNPRKQAYINFRIAGHDTREALSLTGISERTYYLWNQTDRDFDYWNTVGLDELRKNQREKLVGDSFIINANLVQQLDRVFLTKIHLKKNKGQQFTPEERTTLDKLRTIYASPTQQKAVKELVETGKQKGVSILEYAIRLSKPKPFKVIEGEFTEVSDDVPPVQTTLSAYQGQSMEV